AGRSARTLKVPAGRQVHVSSKKLERAKRFELSTPTLARLCSTTELRPRSVGVLRPPNARGGLMADGPGLCKQAREDVAPQAFQLPKRGVFRRRLLTWSSRAGAISSGYSPLK